MRERVPVFVCALVAAALGAVLVSCGPGEGNAGNGQATGEGGHAPEEEDGNQRVELPSGVVYEQIREGSGTACGRDDSVFVLYTATLTDGTVVVAEQDRDRPVEVLLEDAMPGFAEGVAGMRVGGVRRVEVPWELAYGESGRPPIVPERADVVFVVELVSVRGAEPGG